MSNSPTIVVIGGANTDYLARCAQLPRPGDTVNGYDFQEGPGGKGANQAVAVARLGVSVAMVGRFGADERGDKLVAGLEKEGVQTQHIVRDAEHPSGVALISVDEKGEKQILAAQGANQQLTPDDVRAVADTIRSAKVVLSQLEVPVACVLEAARLARAAGARFVLDPAPPADLPDELFPLLTVIRPNAGEAKAITGVDVRDRATARQAAEKLLNKGVEAAAVQAGSDGDLLVWRDGDDVQECWLPRLAVDTVDATGAGDAFAAALSVMLAEGRPYAEAGRFASAAAALATTKVGAQAGLAGREQVRELLERQ